MKRMKSLFFIPYKTSIDVEGGELSSRMVETLIAVNISTTDRYFPSFADVIYAGSIPADAVNRIERPDLRRPAIEQTGADMGVDGIGKNLVVG